MGDARKRKNHMSAKTLIIAAAALAASTAMTVPSFAAGGDGTGPNGTGPGPNANAPAAATTLPLRAQVLFNLLDVNHDGAVDQQEFTALSNAVFNALDKNHDGKLTPDELRGDFAGFGMGGRMGAMMQRGGHFGPGGPGNWQGRFDHRGMGPGMMGRTGFSGPQGLGAGAQPDFASLDSNGDGAITPDEFAAHQQGPAPAPADQPQQ